METTDGGCAVIGAAGVEDTTGVDDAITMGVDDAATMGVDDGTGVDDGRTVVDTAESEKDKSTVYDTCTEQKVQVNNAV